MMNPGTRASSISTSAGVQAVSCPPRHLLSKAPDEPVARKALEHRALDPGPRGPSGRRHQEEADEQAEHEDEQQRHQLVPREPVREERGDGATSRTREPIAFSSKRIDR